MKTEMRRPGLTIRQKSLAERGFVFMRWKERFLVPDHQVRGIRGASYDGKFVLSWARGFHCLTPLPRISLAQASTMFACSSIRQSIRLYTLTRHSGNQYRPSSPFTRPSRPNKLLHSHPLQ